MLLDMHQTSASISEMISILGWPTLESRCNTLRTLMMYKIINNLVDVPTDTILLPSTLQLKGHTEKLQQLPCTVNAYPYSFFHKQSNYGILYPST